MSFLYLAWLATFWSQTATPLNMDAAGDSRNLATSCAASQDTQQIGGFYSLSVAPGRIHSREVTGPYTMVP